MEDSHIPLCIDLDGTLLLQDSLGVFILNLLRFHPLYIFKIPFWLIQGGRPYLKAQLVKEVYLDISELHWNEPLIQWLKTQKQHGRTLCLITASNQHFAQQIALHWNLFDYVWGSSETQNLKSHSKATLLVEKFGVKQFDYAGNEISDFPVWQCARKAILVNLPRFLQKRAEKTFPSTQIF